MASEKGDCEGVKRLLGAGADVNEARSDVSDMMFKLYDTCGHSNYKIKKSYLPTVQHVIQN